MFVTNGYSVLVDPWENPHRVAEIVFFSNFGRFVMIYREPDVGTATNFDDVILVSRNVWAALRLPSESDERRDEQRSQGPFNGDVGNWETPRPIRLLACTIFFVLIGCFVEPRKDGGALSYIFSFDQYIF